MISAPGDRMAWVVKSDTQNRPRRVTIIYDAMTGEQISREGIAQKHPIDRIVAYGVAWHEGALFGWVNQVVGVVTAAMLVMLCVSGAVMWWRRRPDGALGAPPRAFPGAGVCRAFGHGGWWASCWCACRFSRCRWWLC
jgi:uncharacterized iron-regulated membrane protein